MGTLSLFAGGIALAFWGGHELGRRFPGVAALLAVLLLCGAGFLAHLDLRAASLGDGAPSSAGAFLGLLWLLEIVMILLAGTLLLTGWRRGEHAWSRNLFFILFLPLTVYAIYRALPARHPASPGATRTSPASPGAKGTRMDGYILAVDTNSLSDDECPAGSPEFVAGFREGVVKNRARLKP